MDIDEGMTPFLEGRQFSRSLRFPLIERRPTRVVDRISWVTGIVADKRVVHVGCVDHLPLIREKRERGRWLHEQLCSASTRCVGVDINDEGIRYLQEELGYGDVVCADICRDVIPELDGQRWNVMVLGELVEHLDNPVDWLSRLRERFHRRCESLLVTAPNALRWGNTTSALKHQEVINSDHRFWFSPYTLAKILTVSGYRVRAVQLLTEYPIRVRGPRSLRRKCMLSLFPALRETIGAVADFA